jgi:hypothetical protein
MTPKTPGSDRPGSGRPEPGAHAEVVDTLLELQRRLRDARPWASTTRPRTLRPVGKPARDDDVIVLDDLDVTVETTSLAEGGEAERVAQLTARLRRLEDDLLGIYETLGRLAEELETISATSRRGHPTD